MAVLEEGYKSAESRPLVIWGTVVLLTVAATLALVPAPLLLDYPWWFVFPVVVPLLPILGTLFAKWDTDLVASYRISAREYYLAWLGALAPPAVIAFSWPILYWIINGALKWFHVQSAEWLALLVSGLFACFFGFIFMFLSAANLAAQLYPGTAGARSPFYDMNARAARTEIGQVVVAISLPCLVLLIYLDLASAEVDTLLYYVVIFLTLRYGAPLWLMNAETAIERIRRLFEAAGWNAADLANSDLQSETIDLIAASEVSTRSVFIHVITADEAPSPDWTFVFQHLMATCKMSENLDLPPESVAPALVFLDVKPTDSLVSASADQGVRILEVAGAEIDPILLECMNGGETERKCAAARVLEPLIGDTNKEVSNPTFSTMA